uniref:Sushi domain-containing protein n=1 Tax=Catharus ustulatus TaxID=91951 RepID=A0A8C3V4H6_CATUS
MCVLCVIHGVECMFRVVCALCVIHAVWDCGPLPNISHAEPRGAIKEQQSFPVGSKVTFACVPGYTKLPLLSDTIQCLPNSRWSSLPEFCGRECFPSLTRRVFMETLKDQRQNFYAVNTTVRYICRPSYDNTTDQPLTSTCLDNLTWTEDDFCPSAEVTCPRAPSIANGRHSGHSSARVSRGATVSYSCKEGFELLGNASITCTDSGLWSRPLPRCQGVWGPREGRWGSRRVLAVSRGHGGLWGCRTQLMHWRLKELSLLPQRSAARHPRCRTARSSTCRAPTELETLCTSPARLDTPQRAPTRLGASPGASGTRRCSCATGVSGAAARERGMQAGMGAQAGTRGAGTDLTHPCSIPLVPFPSFPALSLS